MKIRLLWVFMLLLTLSFSVGCLRKDQANNGKQMNIQNSSSTIMVDGVKTSGVEICDNNNISSSTSLAQYSHSSVLPSPWVVTKDDGGWQKYTNEYLGISFSFLDEADKIEMMGDQDSISLWGPEKGPTCALRNGEVWCKTSYAYIDLFKYFTYSPSLHFGNFRDYLNTAWYNSFPLPSTLISIKEDKNANGITFYKIDCALGKKNSINTAYYFEYNKPNRAGYDYIQIECPFQPELCDYIVNSFQFD